MLDRVDARGADWFSVGVGAVLVWILEREAEGSVRGAGEFQVRTEGGAVTEFILPRVDSVESVRVRVLATDGERDGGSDRLSAGVCDVAAGAGACREFGRPMMVRELVGPTVVMVRLGGSVRGWVICGDRSESVRPTERLGMGDSLRRAETVGARSPAADVLTEA